MVTSYNGWQASTDPDAIGINKAWAPLGVRFPGGCKAGDVETVLTHVVEQLDARVEPIDLPGPNDEWGYVYKPSANSPNLLSCHSSGTAFDYNATRHPNGKLGTWTPVQVATIRSILNEVDGVVRWLGDAVGTPDEMHFEIRGTPAQVAAVAKRLRAHQEDDMDAAQEAKLDKVAALLADVHSELPTLRRLRALFGTDTAPIDPLTGPGADVEAVKRALREGTG